jgi:hypothetical protein
MTHAAEHVQAVMQMVTGHWVAGAIHAVCKHEIPDALADGPKTIEELASATGTHPDSVKRVTRALGSCGLFAETAPGTIELTEMGQLLRKDVPGSMRGMSIVQGMDPQWRAWGNFPHSLKTGEPAFDALHGMNFWEYGEKDPAFAEAFNDAMTGYSRGTGQAVAASYDFSGIDTLIDVGGGHGFLVSLILQSNPEMKGGVLDLPHVAEGATAMFESMGVADRAAAHGGSFFEWIPAADAYISKHILHDWNDDACVTILQKMVHAMDGDGKVLIIENVIPEGNEPSFGKMLDLEMLNSTVGGRERTEAEFAELFSRAGLTLTRVIPTPSPVCVIEAVKA